MDIFKDKEILEYLGIYQKKELTEEQIEEYMKIKKQIEKLTRTPIEKMYLVGENAWGRTDKNKQPPDKDVLFLVFDKRFKDLEKEKQLLIDYAEDKNMGFILVSLCIYEKKKKMPTEREYLVERFGIKIYESDKLPSTNESIVESEYASFLKKFKSFRTYIYEEDIMAELVRIYILKLGAPINKHRANFPVEVKIANIISKDEKGKQLINDYIKEKNEDKKIEIRKEFEKYLKEIKQVKYDTRLDIKPTMAIYEKFLLQKVEKGKLNLKKLTKEELYIMYVTQHISTYELCDLFEVSRQKIDSKRHYYGIKMFETIVRPEMIEKLLEEANKHTKKYVYALTKSLFLDFEESIMPILKYMSDGETYLLKEFWKFVCKEENLITTALMNKETDSYYKAELCVDLLLQNELIKEVDYKQYKITKKGKDFLDKINHTYVKEITIPTLAKYLDDFKYFSLEFKPGYPTSKDEMDELHNYLRKIAYEQWQKSSNEQLEERDVYKWIVTFINTILEDSNTPEKIKNMENLDDLVYALSKFEITKLKFPKNIYIEEIYKYIENPQISDIIKLAVSNYNYMKANYNINELEEQQNNKEMQPEEHYKKLKEITEAPKPKKRKQKEKEEKVPIPQKVDFEKINKDKKKLGDFCEKMVLCKEKEMLMQAGRSDLIEDVIWMPKERGDGAGYDIESFRKFGDDYEKVYIEVKGTNKNQFNDFYVTINELVASSTYKDKYFICEIINAKKDNPQIRYTQGEIYENFKLKPIQYKVSNIEE